MLLLFVLFVVLPLVELALLVEIGTRIGTAATVALVVATGLVGAALARRQGFAVLARMREELERGEVPASSIVDGAILLVAAALLVTPGVLTDAVGFLCLVPAVRRLAKRVVWRFILARLQGAELRVSVWRLEDDESARRGGPDVIDIEPERSDEG